MRQLQKPILKDGCYAISNTSDNSRKNYITHGGSGMVVNYNANRGEAGQWEKIQVINRGKTKDRTKKDVYSFYSEDEKFMAAVPGDAVWKAANIGAWEEYTLEPTGKANEYFIKSVANDRYLSANYHLFGNVGTSANKDSWEKWTFDAQSGGCKVHPVHKSFVVNPMTAPKALKVNQVSSDFAVKTPIAVSVPNSSAVFLENNAVDFPSKTNDLINRSFPNLTECTIEAWINAPSVGSDIQAIVSSAGPEFVHLQMCGNTVSNAVYFTDGSSMMLDGIPALSPGWHHVALSLKSGNSKVFIDGVQHGATNTQAFSKIKPSNTIKIGKGWQGQRAFNGKIANVRIWNQAKTQTEITANSLLKDLNGKAGLIYHSPTTNAKKFSNANEAIQIPSSATSNVSSVTVEAWVNTSTVGNDIQAIVSSTQADFMHFQISSNTNNQNAVYLNNGQSIMLPIIPSLSPGWHHVAIVVESGNSRVLLDGIQIGTTNTTSFSGLKSSSTVYVGKGWQNGRVCKGQIADVRIWKNRALTNAQLIDYSNTPPPASAHALVFHQK